MTFGIDQIRAFRHHRCPFLNEQNDIVFSGELLPQGAWKFVKFFHPFLCGFSYDKRLQMTNFYDWISLAIFIPSDQNKTHSETETGPRMSMRMEIRF